MKKEEIIRRYGEAAYKRRQEQTRRWDEANPEKVKEREHNQCRKGGKYYQKKLGYDRSGLRAERKGIRSNHQYMWGKYKKIIAPDSQIHHSWLPGTADYNGVALVEAEAHMQGVIKVIKILDGEIRLFTEKEIREQDPEQYAKVYI